MPGQAVVKVTKDDVFGPLVKNYVFNLVPDTTLTSLRVDGKAWRLRRTCSPTTHCCRPDRTPSRRWQRSRRPRRHGRRRAGDHPTGQARVTVTNGGASSVYTVDFDTTITGSDEFDSPTLGPQWQWVRAGRQPVARWPDGALVITAQTGDLQGNANTARNIALQDVNGDWTAESRLVFSRPLADNNEQGGVIAYADDNNYVKLAWEMSSVDARHQQAPRRAAA